MFKTNFGLVYNVFCAYEQMIPFGKSRGLTFFVLRLRKITDNFEFLTNGKHIFNDFFLKLRLILLIQLYYFILSLIVI